MSADSKLRCDFHVHSNASDGTLPPEALVGEAHRAGVHVLALTDHDEVGGVAAARARGEELGVEVWGGVELSVSEDGGRRQMHVLGLGLDASHPGLTRALAGMRSARLDRIHEILARLQGCGVRLGFDDVRACGGTGTLGRPHVARALVESGQCRDVEEAFQRLLGRGRPAYVPSPDLAAARAIDLIHAAGGVASLAHPLLSVGIDGPGGLDAWVERLAALGLDALEVDHPSHTPPKRRRIRRAAGRHGLLLTGGSDFHGDDSSIRLGRGRGDLEAGRAMRDALLERRARIREREEPPGVGRGCGARSAPPSR